VECAYAETLGKALATYVRTLLRGEAVGPPGQGRRPEDPDTAASLPAEALSEEARRGRALFLGQARCTNVPRGPEPHSGGVPRHRCGGRFRRVGPVPCDR